VKRLLCLTIGLIGCSPAPPNGGASSRRDAGEVRDVQVVSDIGVINDASAPRDVGSKTDAGPIDFCADWVERLQLDEQMMANPGFGRRRLERPIVLHHGMAGFRDLGPLEYFSSVPDHLRGMGYEVYLTQVLPIHGSLLRAEELEQQLRCINHIAGSDGVHLIGHSQGGIDARMVASRQGDERLIHSLTFLATPHRGSAAADAFLALPLAGRGPLTQALMLIYSGLAGRPDAEANLNQQMQELSRPHMEQFNRETPDHPEVRYRSWAGRSVSNRLVRDVASEACDSGIHSNPSGRDIVDPLFVLVQPAVTRAQGPNDGLVAVSSAKWGTFMGCVPADHLDEVGMLGDRAPQRFSGFSYLELFETIAEDLTNP
jgi:triacylglycerol lipase